ncbi:MAG: serine/threonine protein phosphatase PrpC [Myxococcota bacterium]
MNTWASTDVGRRRRENEDSFLIAPQLGLVAVADGMGGFERGDIASQLACEVLKESIAENREVLEAYRREPTVASRGAVLDVLEESIQQACRQVHEAATALASGGRMGTTMDAMLVLNSTAFIAHVGDGRIYLFRGREIHQLTEDHTLVNEKLKEGSITAEEARVAVNRSVITRALGAFPRVQVDTLHFELDVDDRLLLCSDGLHRYIGPRELSFSLADGLSQDTATTLVADANGRGGRDNITVVVCALKEDTDTSGDALPNRERMEALRRVDLFATCTYRELMAVCQFAEQRTVRSGAVLFQEGDPGLECFFIQQGRVRIEKEGTLLTIMGPGTYFGEMSFLDFPKRSATAVIEEDTEFLVLHRDRFMLLMKLDANLSAKLSWQLLKKLSRIVRTSNDRLTADITAT